MTRELHEEKLVAKLYDWITSTAVIIWASIARWPRGFIIALLVETYGERKNKNDTLSDWSKQ